MRLRLLAVPLLAAWLAGCDTKELIVESNTAWRATFANSDIQPIQGSGNSVIDLADAPSNVCWEVQKLTSAGTLRAYLRDETWFGIGVEYDGDQTTTEPGGIVGGCNR